MGTIRSNKVVGIIEGTVGDLVFVHYADGRVIVRRRPVRTASFTEGEIASQRRFGQGPAYVQRLKANPDLYALYQAAARIARKRPCDLAMSDFLNPPEIREIDVSAYTGQIGQAIQIKALDNFAVASVRVILSQLDGLLIEQGAATVQGDPCLWLYATTANVPPGQTVVVHVTACDLSGNAVTKSIDRALRPAG